MLGPKDLRGLNKDAKEHSRKSVRDFDPAGILRECECFDEVLDMVRKGKFTRDIVAFIHGRGELTHVSYRALTYKVQNFKDELLTPAGEVAEERIASGEDDFDEEDIAAIGHVLRKLFHRQAKRVNMETDTEMSLNKLFAGTHKEYLTAIGMGERLIKVLKQLDMFDTVGIEGAGKQKTSKIDSVMVKPESRHKILGILNLIMDKPDMFKNVSSLDAARVKKEKKKRPKRNKPPQLTDGSEDQKKAQ